MSQPQNQTLSAGQINENKVRTIAFLVLVSVVVYLFTRLALIPVLLVADFGLRSFDLGKYSPLAQISDVLVRTLKLGVKPIFYPPKRFAARIGLLFSVTILVLHFSGISTLLVSGILGFLQPWSHWRVYVPAVMSTTWFYVTRLAKTECASAAESNVAD